MKKIYCILVGLALGWVFVISINLLSGDGQFHPVVVMSANQMMIEVKSLRTEHEINEKIKEVNERMKEGSNPYIFKLEQENEELYIAARPTNKFMHRSEMWERIIFLDFSKEKYPVLKEKAVLLHGRDNGTAAGAANEYTYTVVNSYPHDPDAFTQGLVCDNGVLYEGTGHYKRSSLREVKLETGVVSRTHSLPPQYFGEGITIYNERIIHLTWKSNIGFVYNRDNFELLRTFDYSTEGWGITHNGTRLIMSDGTSTLYFLDPITFEETGRIEVRDRNNPVTGLNELEFVRGEIFANVWKTNRIARIDPATGRVTGWIDLEGLLKPKDGEKSAGGLNGIAYDAENDRLFVTGKYWPKLFEIKLIGRRKRHGR